MGRQGCVLKMTWMRQNPPMSSTTRQNKTSTPATEEPSGKMKLPINVNASSKNAARALTQREICKAREIPGIKSNTTIITSKPTIAGAVPRKMEHRFETASLADCEFLRLPPAKGRCRLTGLSRSGLVAVAQQAGAFISCRLAGRTRGAALVDRKLLVAHLRALAGKEDEV